MNLGYDDPCYNELSTMTKNQASNLQFQMINSVDGHS
jgi:hypothetical protein